MDRKLLPFKADYELLMDELNQVEMELNLHKSKHVLDQDDSDEKRLDKKYHELMTRINMNPYIHKENNLYIFKEEKRPSVFD